MRIRLNCWVFLYSVDKVGVGQILMVRRESFPSLTVSKGYANLLVYSQTTPLKLRLNSSFQISHISFRSGNVQGLFFSSFQISHISFGLFFSAFLYG